MPRRSDPEVEPGRFPEGRPLLGSSLLFAERVSRCRAALEGQRTWPYDDLIARLMAPASAEEATHERGVVARILRRVRGAEAPETTPQASEKIDQYIAETSLLEDRARGLCREIVEDLEFKLAAFQIVHRHKPVIETIAGEGEALDWVGAATHALPPATGEGSDEHVDIQAEIVLKVRGEVIRGDDRRFDKYLFKVFHHEKALRAFLPVVVARRAGDRVVEGGVAVTWHIVDVQGRLGIEPRPAPGYELEVLGTIEAGFLHGDEREIDEGQLMKLAQLASHHAPHIYAATLTAALERVATTAMELCNAQSGSIHLLRRPFEVPTDTHRYTYNLVVGSAAAVGSPSPRGDGGIADPPRRGGLGDRALSERRPLVMPDPDKNEPYDSLRTHNPKIWNEHRVRAMAAFPLLARGEAGGAKEEMGVCYVHHFEDFRFEKELVERVQKLIQQASDGVRVAIERSEQREHWRRVSALRNLLGSSLLVDPESTTIEDVACNASNLLGADVIGILHRTDVEEMQTFEKVAGLLPESFVRDACAEIMVADRNQGLFAPDVRSSDWLPRASTKHHQIEKERMTSAAGVRLQSHRARPIGALYIGFRGYHPFRDSETAVIRMLGTLIAAVLEGRPPSGQVIIRAMGLVATRRQ